MKYNHEHPLRVMTLASGYDSQCLALERLKERHPGFDYDLVAWAEFDPENKSPLERQPAVIAHNLLFPQYAERNYGDLTKIDWEQVPDFDLLTTSTPCQSISQAGLQHGFEKGSGTRSSIIWNIHDCVRTKKPRYIFTENVAAIISDKFFPTFKMWLDELERIGYKNFLPPSFPTPWKENKKTTRKYIINSADMGVPQNRERMFCISILRTEDEPEPRYDFPTPVQLEKHLIDVLEENVAEKYFISDKMLKYFRSVDNDSRLGKGTTTT